MGWTSIPAAGRPGTEQLNRMVDQWIAAPNAHIIDRSGWMQHGRHQFVLMEQETARPDEEARNKRFIAVIIVEHWRDEIAYKIVEESMGPLELDCPMRIMNQLSSPPVGEFSREWRARVLRNHQDMGPRKSILRKLRKEYPKGELRIVLNTGQQVTYEQGRYRGKRNTAAYWNAQKQCLTILQPKSIDAAATLALWENRDGDRDDETTT